MCAHPSIKKALEAGTLSALERNLQNLKNQTSGLRSQLSGIQVQIANMHEQQSRISRILAERGFGIEIYVDDDDVSDNFYNFYDFDVKDFDDENVEDSDDCPSQLTTDDIAQIHRLRNLILSECAERETLLKTYRSNEKQLILLEKKNIKLNCQVQIMRETYNM